MTKPPSDPTNERPRTAKVFWSGRSQAVRLPKDLRFDTDEVLIAAHVLSLDAILVTNNVAEFARIPNVKTEDWTAG